LAAGLSLTTVARADPATVEWSKDWPRVKLWEVVAAASLTVGDTVYEETVPLPTKATWTQPILFDTWARSVFRADNLGVQSAASTTSDIMFKAGALVPFLVDDYFSALSIHQNVEVAWQLTVIDFESLGVSGIISLAAEHGVGRAQPYTLSCVDGKVVDPQGVSSRCAEPATTTAVSSADTPPRRRRSPASCASTISSCRSSVVASRTSLPASS